MHRGPAKEVECRGIGQQRFHGRTGLLPVQRVVSVCLPLDIPAPRTHAENFAGGVVYDGEAHVEGIVGVLHGVHAPAQDVIALFLGSLVQRCVNIHGDHERILPGQGLHFFNCLLDEGHVRVIRAHVRFQQRKLEPGILCQLVLFLRDVAVVEHELQRHISPVGGTLQIVRGIFRGSIFVVDGIVAGRGVDGPCQECGFPQIQLGDIFVEVVLRGFLDTPGVVAGAEPDPVDVVVKDVFLGNRLLGNQGQVDFLNLQLDGFQLGYGAFLCLDLVLLNFGEGVVDHLHGQR